MSSGFIRLRPRDDALYASHNRTVLCTRRDGFIYGTGEFGLFVHETRLLSLYRYMADGRLWIPSGLSTVEPNSWLGYYIAQSGAGIADALQHALELKLARHVSDGFHETVEVTNFTQKPVRTILQLELDADFADATETKDLRRQHGRTERRWRRAADGGWEILFDYHAEHGTARIHRGLIVRIVEAATPPIHEDGRVSFEIDLQPLACWNAHIDFVPFIDEKAMSPVCVPASFDALQTERDRERARFLRDSTCFSAPCTGTLTHVVVNALEQARRDLSAMRLYDLDVGQRAWTMGAGLPLYIGLFGRDTLTASWQAGLASTEMMAGVLPQLARWQGSRIDDWRDEQPGRMLHEAHTGPLAMLNYDPRRRYYGSITTSAFYPVVVSELWHWTGDKDLVRPLIEPALKALRWLDEYSDPDGAGFYKYQTRSTQGLENQAWKDSGDAIVHEDGSQAKTPIATCEEQGFVYLAKMLLSLLLWWFDRKDEADRLYQEGHELRKRFNQAFWMEDEGFFAMGLDGDGRRIESIGSNGGHCLATGIADDALVKRAVRRLMTEDLFSGWGVRTLSSRHPAYNPYSYHRGTVWPVEQGTFVLGFLRYGLHTDVQRLAKAQFEAALLFDHYRLPELFGGHPRDAAHPFPALYPEANWPQAWSASSLFCHLQAMLGLYPFAPLNLLFVDPHLPEWLPEITLTNLHVGWAIVTIRFYRVAGGGSEYQVRELIGNLRILRQPSPWSLTAGWGERLKDVVSSLLPV